MKRQLSPLRRARRRKKVAELALVSTTVVNCILGCVVVVTRVRYGPGFTPLAWALVGALTAFLVAIVCDYLAGARLNWMTHLVDRTRRRAVRAGLAGDRTAEQEAWHVVKILTGDDVTP